jgi:hypothetical protein
MSSPIKRTLARLRKLGYHADIVERRLPGCFITRDLFGIADVLAAHPGERAVLLVQATTAAHVADRLRRVRGQPDLPALLATGVRVEVWGWAKRGAAGTSAAWPSGPGTWRPSPWPSCPAAGCRGRGSGRAGRATGRPGRMIEQGSPQAGQSPGGNIHGLGEGAILHPIEEGQRPRDPRIPRNGEAAERAARQDALARQEREARP